MACDLRIADPRASLCFKHVRMAVTTAWGIVPRLVGAVGQAAAARLLFTAQVVKAAEALRLGLVSAVSSPGGSVDLAETWAAEIALGGPEAVAGMKAILAAASGLDPAGVSATECDRFVKTWTSADHAEAVERFFQGRRADARGGKVGQD